MKAKMIAVTLVLCFAGVAVCFAEDANMGTWKLNEAKSKPSAGVQKNNMVVYEPAGDSVKITLDGTGGDGQSTHTEWTGKFDGKDYPVTGDSASDSRSYKRVNARTLAFTARKDSKVTMSGRIAVSVDGKTRTVTSNGTDSTGKKVSWTSVYDKQ